MRSKPIIDFIRVGIGNGAGCITSSNTGVIIIICVVAVIALAGVILIIRKKSNEK